MSLKTIDILGLDPGNGFIKIKASEDVEKVVVDRMIYSKIKTSQLRHNNFNDLVKTGDRYYLIGEEAIELDSVHQFVNEADEKRYDKEFIKFLYGFIYKHTLNSKEKKNVSNVIINKMCIGLPNIIYKNIVDDVTKAFQNKKYIVNINDKEITFCTKKVKVVPQPMGTLFATERKKSDKIIIIDIGFGTVDYTIFTNGKIENNYGINNGLRKILLDYQEYLGETYPGENLNVHKTLEAFRNNRIKYYGKTEKIEGSYKKELIEDHLDDIFTSVIERYNSIASFDKVIFTGGVSKDYTKYINKKKYSNIYIAPTSQEANVNGFYKIAGKIK